MKKILLYVANRIWLILGLYVASLLLGAALFALVEARSFGDGLWWAVVTALTIGYGDITPVTTAGRIAGIVLGHFWIFVIAPMVIANIILRLIEDKNEFTDAEQIEMMQRLKRIDEYIDAARAAADKR